MFDRSEFPLTRDQVLVAIRDKDQVSAQHIFCFPELAYIHLVLPSPRFWVIARGAHGSWYLEATTSDVLQYAKRGAHYGIKYYDTLESKWVLPGKKRLRQDPRARIQYQEIPGNFDELANPHIYGQTIEEWQADFASSDDTFTEGDKAEHLLHVRSAMAMGRSVKAGVLACYPQFVEAMLSGGGYAVYPTAQ